MLDFEIRTTECGTGHVNRIPIFHDSKYRILTHFISSEYSAFPNDIRSCIDTVLSGEASSMGFAGNSCIISVLGNVTTIECIIDDADVGEPCDIDTKELKETLLEYEKRIKNTHQEENYAES